MEKVTLHIVFSPFTMMGFRTMGACKRVSVAGLFNAQSPSNLMPEVQPPNGEPAMITIVQEVGKFKKEYKVIESHGHIKLSGKIFVTFSYIHTFLL